MDATLVSDAEFAELTPAQVKDANRALRAELEIARQGALRALNRAEEAQTEVERLSGALEAVTGALRALVDWRDAPRVPSYYSPSRVNPLWQRAREVLREVSEDA